MQGTPIAAEFFTRRTVEAGRAHVAYRRAGRGPVLVMLHGFPLSGLTWRKTVPLLAEHFTCLAPDLVGLGDTTSPSDDDFTSEGQARVLQQALRALGVESYAMIGNDTGGWIARELALLEPERVTGLVLTNTEIPGHRPPWIPMYQALAALPGARAVFQAVLSSRAMRRSPMGFGGCFSNVRLIEGEFFDLFVRPLLGDPERALRLCDFLVQMKFARLDRFAELHAQLSMPVTLVWGAADPTFPERLARQMGWQLPNLAAIRTIQGAKLLPQEEFPDQLAAHVLAALGVRNA